jgi:glycosyltransferase involved in cell wall biosynthesis
MAYHSAVNVLRELAFQVWRSPLVGAAVRERLKPLAVEVTRLIAAPMTFDSRKAPATARGPVVLSMLAAANSGVARAGRLTAAALEAAGLEVRRHDAHALATAARYADAPLPEGGVWIAHCNPPEALAMFARAPKRVWRDRYRIGYWAWELPCAPELWLRAARLFHEVWAPSRFVAASFEGALAPVRVMPHPVSLPPTVRADRAGFGLAEDRVWILAMADVRSSAHRKNALGAVEAFARAFPEPQKRAALLVKLVGGSLDAGVGAQVRARIGGRDDIRLFEDELSDERTNALLASIDIFLSLHRAEGFGLGLAEAMALGRACLATGWSGNLEFMEGLEPMLTPYRLAPVQDPAGVYDAPGEMWAEPDLDAAAAKLRALCENDALRSEAAAAGPPRIAALRTSWAREQLEGMAFYKHYAPEAAVSAA